jgi:hypothetical protein
MKKNILILILLQIAFLFTAEPFPHETYIVSYGQAPVGQHPIGATSAYYSEETCKRMARKEAENFAAGQIYGYTFEYQIDNPITKRQEYFKLTPQPAPNFSGRNVTFEETESDFRDRKTFKLTYKLLEQQKNRRKNFAGTLAESSKGEDFSQDCQHWNLRQTAFENAVKNAILNKARKDIKSRPEYICGKVMLKSSPIFSIKSGLWKTIVHVSLTIDEITYQTSY